MRKSFLMAMVLAAVVFFVLKSSVTLTIIPELDFNKTTSLYLEKGKLMVEIKHYPPSGISSCSFSEGVLPSDHWTERRIGEWRDLKLLWGVGNDEPSCSKVRFRHVPKADWNRWM